MNERKEMRVRTENAEILGYVIVDLAVAIIN